MSAIRGVRGRYRVRPGPAAAAPVVVPPVARALFGPGVPPLVLPGPALRGSRGLPAAANDDSWKSQIPWDKFDSEEDTFEDWAERHKSHAALFGMTDAEHLASLQFYVPTDALQAIRDGRPRKMVADIDGPAETDTQYLRRVYDELTEFYEPRGNNIAVNLNNLLDMKKEAGESISHFLARFNKARRHLDEKLPDSVAIAGLVRAIDEDVADLYVNITHGAKSDSWVHAQKSIIDMYNRRETQAQKEIERLRKADPNAAKIFNRIVKGKHTTTLQRTAAKKALKSWGAKSNEHTVLDKLIASLEETNDSDSEEDSDEEMSLAGIVGQLNALKRPASRKKSLSEVRPTKKTRRNEEDDERKEPSSDKSTQMIQEQLSALTSSVKTLVESNLAIQR